MVLITAPDIDTARKIARRLVDSGIAACVNLVPGVLSIYRWKGAVEEAGEILLVAKTVRARVAELERALAEVHPYEVPECVVLEPRAVGAKYLEWLVGETRSTRTDGR